VKAALSRLGDVATFVRGVTFKPDDVVPLGTKGSVACMRTKNVQSQLDLSDVWAVPASFAKRADQLLHQGDVLVSSANSWNLVGRCCSIPNLPWKTTFGGFVSALRSTDCDRLDPVYLFRWFSSPRVQAVVRSFGQKTTNISNLNIGRCLDLAIPLPPIPEQRRIAAILDRADEVRAKRRAALAQLDTLTQSVFLDMFGDVSSNDRKWPRALVGDVATIRRGGSPRPIESFLGGEINWIKIGDGTRGSDIYIDRTEDRITSAGLRKTVFLRSGSLILANSGVSLGFARILRIDGCIHDGWLSIEDVDDGTIDKLFLLKLLNSVTDHFRRIAPKGTQPNLNIDLLRRFSVVIPPLARQKRFASAVRNIENQKGRSLSAVEQMDALFASLQHRAFRGEL
jgi:type I restriction enzyme S subunit